MKIAQRLVFLIVIGVISIVITKWVGDLTIYADSVSDRRLLAHTAILNNEAPGGGTWKQAGMNSTNVRVATVYVASKLSSLTSLSINRTYALIDLLCLMASLAMIFRIHALWLSSEQAFAGIFLFAALLPLTMLFAYFHPWDRPSLLLWSLMIYFAATERFVLFVCMLALAVVVKFDSITAAALLIFVGFSRQHNFQVLGKFFIASIVGLSMVILLTSLIPNGFEPVDYLALAKKNLASALSMGPFYPPLLVYGLLVPAGLVGWQESHGMPKRLFVCGLALLVPHVLFTNFEEIRAQVGSIVCMLPLAVVGLTKLRYVPSAQSGRSNKVNIN
jgi:hypothetical protein